MKSITSDDPLQKGYTYQLHEHTGKNFASQFTPELTPKQMLELGVFGGAYFDGVPTEFPPEWFEKARLSQHGVDPHCNYFRVIASQSLEVWQQKGWIYADDPRGWFHWYCRYYLGRRIPGEDDRQIARWKAIKRHISQIQKACQPGDASCHTKQRQAVMQWAYDSRWL